MKVIRPNSSNDQSAFNYFGCVRSGLLFITVVQVNFASKALAERLVAYCVPASLLNKPSAFRDR